MYYLKIIYSFIFLCLIICKNSLANIGSDDVEDGSSKLANSDGNQDELKTNADVKAIVETGIILLIDQVATVIFVR